MAQRSSRALILGLGALFAVVGAVAAFVLTQAPPSPLVEHGTPQQGEVHADAPHDELRPTAPDAPRAAASVSDDRAEVTPEAQRELDEALWVEGRVVFPDGSPLDEQVFVLAQGKDFKHRDGHRARVANDGSFRVAFQQETKTGWLRLDAPHLYLETPLRVRLPAKEAQVLEPALGALIEGRITPPLGVVDPGAQLHDVSVNLRGWSASIESAVTRLGKVGADLRFQLRGVPPNLDYWLSCDPIVWPQQSRQQLRLAAGQTLELELTFELGAVVRGRVRDEAGQAVAKANVVVRTKNEKGDWWGSQRATTTKDDGSFEVRGAQAGEMRIDASKQGLLPAKSELGRIDDGATREALELALPLGDTLSGKVLWPDGKPAWNAVVTVEETADEDDDEFDFSGFRSPSVKTGSDGSFRVTGLKGAPYKVSATAKSSGEQADQDDERAAGETGDEARPVEAASGAREDKPRGPRWSVEVENIAANTSALELVLQGGASISGHVTDDRGVALDRFTLVAVLDDPRTPWRRNSQDTLSKRCESVDGSFTLSGLSDGTWKVRATALGYADMRPVDVTIPGHATALTLAIPRAASISGRVLDPQGKPAHKAVVEVEHNGEQTSFSILGGSNSATADSKGNFKLRRAPVGRVKLTATLPAFADSPPLELELAPGAVQENLELRLRAGARLTGEIRASSSNKGGTWTVNVHNEAANEWKSTETDAAGRFQFDALSGGTYQVNASAQQHAEDGEVSVGASISKRVEVLDGQTLHVVLGAESGALVTVSGSVRAGTRGIDDAEISISRNDDGEYLNSSVRTDAGGRYSIALPPGRYWFNVEADGTQISREVVVASSAAQNEDFELGAGTLRGRVVQRDGTPVRGAQVTLRVDRAESELHAEGLYGNATTRDDGTFEFANLRPGSFTVTASGRSFRRPKATRDTQLGRVSKRGLVLAAGATIDGIELVMDEGGAIVGRVTRADGTAPDRAWVSVREADGEVIEGLYDHVGSDGQYRIEGLAPGRYSVRASGGDEISAESATVEVASATEVRVELRLERAGWVDAVVEDSTGAIVGASFEVVGATGRISSFGFGGTQPTGGEGRWLGPLSPGTYEIRATNHDRNSGRASVRVEAGGHAQVRIRLEAN